MPVVTKHFACRLWARSASIRLRHDPFLPLVDSSELLITIKSSPLPMRLRRYFSHNPRREIPNLATVVLRSETDVSSAPARIRTLPAAAVCRHHGILPDSCKNAEESPCRER